MGMNIKNDFMEERLRGMFTYSDVSETIDDTNQPIRILREQVSDLNYKVNGIENYIKFLACIEDPTLIKDSGLSDDFLYRLVAKNKDAFFHIPVKSESFIINCLKIAPELIRYMPLVTIEMCKAALSVNPTLYPLLMHYPEGLDEWMVTVRPKNIMHIRNQTKYLCEKAIMADYTSLQHIRSITPELCRYAYAVNKDAIKYMGIEIPEEIWKDYINGHPERINDIPRINRPSAMVECAIGINPMVVISGDYYTTDELKMAIKAYPLVYRRLPKPCKSRQLMFTYIKSSLIHGLSPRMNVYEMTYTYDKTTDD